MLKLKAIFIFVFIVFLSNAQSESFKRAFECGVFGGGSYYIGDLNPNRHFVYSSPAFGLIARYNYSTRHSLRLTANYGKVYGNDSDSKDPYQINRNLSFHSNILELAIGFEVDLFKYRINDMKYPISPYFIYQIAYFRMNPIAMYNDEEVSLQELGTEGQGSSFSDKNRYKLNQLSVPLGIGVKFNIAKRFAMSLEYGIRLTFTDYLDDVSGQYISATDLAATRGPLAAYLSDPSLNNISYHSPGSDRGNPNTKDWYSFYGVMLTFKPWKNNICDFQQR